MTNFMPYSSLFGGILIGLSAALLLFLNGRVAGISGIVGGLLSPKPGDVIWRICFIAGLLAGPLVLAVLGKATPAIHVNGPWWLWVSSGLLVGYGTQLGGGCTSGHGVCGLARLSRRSLVATLTFMSVAALTVYFMRHIWESGI